MKNSSDQATGNSDILKSDRKQQKFSRKPTRMWLEKSKEEPPSPLGERIVNSLECC